MPDAATILPAPPPSVGDGRVDVGVSLKIPIPASAGLSYWPTANFSGALLLDRVITLALSAKGLFISGSVIGELNDCFGIFSVRDHRCAIHVILAELKDTCLLNFAKIGWLDTAEGTWRCARPAGVPVDFGALVSLAEVERQRSHYLASAAACRATVEAIKQAALTQDSRLKPSDSHGS